MEGRTSCAQPTPPDSLHPFGGASSRAKHALLLESLILPRLHEPAQSVDETFARRDLVRAILIARRDGLETARAWITSQSDPFGAFHYSARLEPDGGLAMWSVGRDGVDDGGVVLSEATGPRPLDTVVRCREP